MAGGNKLDVKKLAERREKKLDQAQKYLDKIRALQSQAIELDTRISNNCDHPKESLKLIKFTTEIPQSSIWLCQLCYQVVETKEEKKVNEERDKNIKQNIRAAKANTKPRGPKKVRKIKQKKS